MEKIIDVPQKSDMGNGFGHIANATNQRLEEALNWIKNNTKTWGTIIIYRKGDIVRKFDYNLYNDNQFYHHLSGWEYDFLIDKIDFIYCFMGEDYDIYLK